MVFTVCRVSCRVICEGAWGIFSDGGGIDMVDGLCVWVEMSAFE